MTGGSITTQCYAVGAAAKTVDPLWTNLCNEAVITALEISESPSNNIVTPTTGTYVIQTATTTNCGNYVYTYKGKSDVVAASGTNYGTTTANLSFPFTVYNAVTATTATATLTNHQPGNISNP